MAFFACSPFRGRFNYNTLIENVTIRKLKG
jgi:hypothetical protein